EGFETLLQNLGVALSSLGEWEQAETHLRRALDLIQARHGQANDICPKVYNLAYVLHSQGKFTEALKLYREAAAMLSKTSKLGAFDPSPFWGNFGMCQALLDDRRGAIDSLDKSLQMYDRRLDDVASFRSERGTRQAWDSLIVPWRCLATLALAPEATADDVVQAWNWSLRINGRSLDTMVRYHQLQRRLQGDPAVARLAER